MQTNRRRSQSAHDEKPVRAPPSFVKPSQGSDPHDYLHRPRPLRLAEPGACAFGQTEVALALAIAQKLAGILSGEGHSVLLTREGDIEDDWLAFRADLANEQSADAFISIHCNAAAYEAAKGVEVWCFPGSSAGNALAQSVYDRLEAANYTLGRGVKSANFAVLRLTDMPAVLVECAFITSASDIAVLMDKDGQNRIARAIADGLLNWADIAGIACVEDS